MKHQLSFKKHFALTITLFAFLLYGCDISDTNRSSSTEELSNEELEVAGQIIAESLSDQNDGIFASLNDAFTLPSSSSISTNSTVKSKYTSAVFNAAMAKTSSSAENNYTYNYDPDSGIHVINFSRTDNNDNVSKESSAELQYIYYDSEGSFIYSPRLENDRIETIEYTGIRTGSIVSPNKVSTYKRNDMFTIEGLTSDLITISGAHEGSGEFKTTRENGDSIERSYTLNVEFLDVKVINQKVSDDGSLENGVEGALAYEMVIDKSINGNESLKTVNGTIEFNGDGTALLRFQDVIEGFKVKLDDGNLLEDDEFEGFVQSINPDGNGSFALSDGETYLFNSDTQIDSEGDLTSLEEVQAILGSVVRVKAEGNYIDNTAGAHIIRSVKFEYEDDDLEFEDFVEEVNSESSTFTLADGTVLTINEETVFDGEGDLNSLEDVIWALDNEFQVEAEGDLTVGDGNTLIVSQVKFELEEDGLEFEDDVQSFNLENSSFTLVEGGTYIINENTTFHEKTDLASLEAVAALLTEGGEVEAEGDYIPQPDGSLLVKKVKFETDDLKDEESDEKEGDDPETSEFEGEVNSADASGKTIEVSGVVYHILQSTEFGDDIQSLGNLVGALKRGDRVFADGEYYFDSEKNIAIEIEFDIERSGEDDEFEDTKEQEFDFEAAVSSVDLASKKFILTGGLTLLIDGDTQFDDGDIESLEQLADALNNGENVEAEGEYYISEGGNNIVIEVEFETDSKDNGDDGDDDEEEEEPEEFEFEGVVSSATSTSFILGGETFFVNNDTEFDDDDIESMSDLIDALNDGDEVEAEGEYYIDNGDNIVIEVKFEVEENDEGDDDSEDDEEEDERQEFNFDGSVNSATSSSFNLDGETFIVNDDTKFNGNDVRSMQELIDAINDGDEVDAKGKYYEEEGDNIVIRVKFDVEENDEGDDDSEDDEEEEEPEEFEFEGVVSSATSTSFILGGETFFVNNDTEFDDDDIESMSDLIDALNDGDEVEAEGEYYIDNGDNIVIEVKFEVEENDEGDDDSEDDEEEDERQEFNFDGSVNSATSSSFNLDGETFIVNDDTKFNGNDVRSMQELIDAINDGDEVDAKGKYYEEEGDNIVIRVKFDVEENDEGDDGSEDDEEEDPEEFELEGLVSSANSNSFVVDEETFLVNDDTKFKGKIKSMNDLIDALNDGDEVEADGEYYVDGDDNVVIEVKFEVEENDEGDDDE